MLLDSDDGEDDVDELYNLFWQIYPSKDDRWTRVNFTEHDFIRWKVNNIEIIIVPWG